MTTFESKSYMEDYHTASKLSPLKNFYSDQNINLSQDFLNLKVSLYFLLASITFMFLYNSAFAAGVVVNSTDPTKTSGIVQTSKGITQINTAAPIDYYSDHKESNYFSFNQFEQYNVDAKGLIINTDNKTEETIILEVTGKDRTVLKGPITVIGNQARLILVNPNGISCDNCSFNDVDEVELRTDKYISFTDNGLEWQKDLNSDIRIEKGGIEVKDGSLTLSSGGIEIEGAVTVSEVLQIAGNAAAENKKNKYAIDINVDSPITAKKIFLMTTGKNGGIKAFISPQATITSKENICIGTKGSLDITGRVYAADDFKICGKDISIFNYAKETTNDTGQMTKLSSKGALKIKGSKVYVQNGVELKADKGYLKIIGEQIVGGGDFKSGNTLVMQSSEDISFNSLVAPDSVFLEAKNNITATKINASQNADIELYGKKIDVKNILDAKKLLVYGEEMINDFKLNNVKDFEILNLVIGPNNMDLNITAPTKIAGNFKFTGRNFKNQNAFEAENIILDLSGDFINDVNGTITASGGWRSTSKGFTNYNKMDVAKVFQVSGDYLVNDNQGAITAGSIKAYLVGKRDDGNSIYQGADAVLEAKEADMELIAEGGGAYFGYKKEFTGDGDNKDGFKFVGSKLLSRGGPIHIQSGGDVIFDGTQLFGEVIVEAKGEIKENNPTVLNAYPKGKHSVIKKKNKIRTVMKPVQKQRQVLDYVEEHCKTWSWFGGCALGQWEYINHYRTESYFESVAIQESYVEETTVEETYFQNVILKASFSEDKKFSDKKADLIFKKKEFDTKDEIPSVNSFKAMIERYRKLVADDFCTETEENEGSEEKEWEYKHVYLTNSDYYYAK